MNALILYVFLALSIFLLGLSDQIPWWAIAIPGIATGFFQRSSLRAFIDAFIVAFSVWMIMALVQDSAMGFRISTRIAGVFRLPFCFFAVIITGLVAGLTVGAAAWCGEALRVLFKGANHIPGGK